MPELPEVEVLRRGLERGLVGDRVRRVEVYDPRLRERVSAEALRRAASGRRFEAMRRRGKYLLMDLEGSHTLICHLGMSGRLTLVQQQVEREPHEHVALFLESGRRLRYRDPRRFGLILVRPSAQLEEDPHLARLGLEPLDAKLTGGALRAAASGRRGPVKGFLMDGRALAGVGNIYANEALFAAGIHPRRSVSRLSSARWERLAKAVQGVLERAIDDGGTTLNDFADPDGRSGYFQVSLTVYGRAGEGCPRCATPIRRTVQGGRSTFYCPRCQR